MEFSSTALFFICLLVLGVYANFNIFFFLVISQQSVHLISFLCNYNYSNYRFLRKWLLMPQDFLISSERQMTIRLSVWDKLSLSEKRLRPWKGLDRTNKQTNERTNLIRGSKLGHWIALGVSRFSSQGRCKHSLLSKHNISCICV